MSVTLNIKKGTEVYPKGIAYVYIPATVEQDGVYYFMPKNGDTNLIPYRKNSSFSKTEGDLQRFQAGKHQWDNPTFTDGNKPIGTATGITIQFNGNTYYQIVWVHEWYEHGFLGFSPKLQTETVTNAYVKETEIQTKSDDEQFADDEAKNDAELQKYLDLLNGTGSKAGLTASGGLTDSKRNFYIGAFLISILALLGFAAYKKLSK